MSKVYRVNIDKPELIDGISAEAERRGVSRPTVVQDAVEIYLALDGHTKRLMDAQDKLHQRLKDANERVRTAEDKADVFNSKIVALENQNKEIAKTRDSLNSANDNLRQAFSALTNAYKGVLVKVLDAQEAGVFGCRKALKAIDVEKYIDILLVECITGEGGAESNGGGPSGELFTKSE